MNEKSWVCKYWSTFLHFYFPKINFYVQKRGTNFGLSDSLGPGLQIQTFGFSYCHLMQYPYWLYFSMQYFLHFRLQSKAGSKPIQKTNKFTYRHRMKWKCDERKLPVTMASKANTKMVNAFEFIFCLQIQRRREFRWSLLHLMMFFGLILSVLLKLQHFHAWYSFKLIELFCSGIEIILKMQILVVF